MYAAALLRQMHFYELAIMVRAHPHPGDSEAYTVSCVRTNASNEQKRNVLQQRELPGDSYLENHFFKDLSANTSSPFFYLNTRVTCEKYV